MRAQKKDRRLILLGAGNAHLQAVRYLRMHPLKDTEVVLVNEATEIPYSAMLPAYFAGDFSWVDISFDLVKFCATHGVRWVEGTITNLDLESKRVEFKDRASLEFDVVSLNTGSQPTAPLGFKPSSDFFLTKPLSALAKRIDLLTERWLENPIARRFAVVGGGAGGLELALALKKKWAGLSAIKIEVIEASNRLLPHNPPKAGELFESRLRGAGIGVKLNASVARMEEGALVLENGETLAFDGGVLATKAIPNSWLANAAFDKDENGFMKVSRCLQSTSHDFVFGAGDAVAFPDPLPKAGVFAVREGPVLAQNLSHFLSGSRLHPYRPQKFYLALFNTSDQEAVMSYGPLVLKGNWARRWKDRIDKSWMDRFAGKMRTMPEGQMFCGGCASKIDALTLERALSGITSKNDHSVLAGVESFEDAALLKRGRGIEGFTIDFFRTFIDDPYLMGQVAATNALNDLWAKGITPKFALSMAGLPDTWTPRYQRRYLEELMAGASASLADERVSLVGGHTSQLADPMIGFSVWGEGTDEIYLKKGLQPGDRLILTKPLGTGILLAALMRGNCRAPWFSSLIYSMRLPHSSILPLMSQMGVKACTDISGFGLARHLLEMCRQSKVAVNIDSNGLPELPGTFEMMNEHIFSQLHGDNKKAVEGFVDGQLNEVAFDPQTSGGLLIAIRPEKSEELLQGLHAAGFIHAMSIGEVVRAEQARLIV